MPSLATTFAFLWRCLGNAVRSMTGCNCCGCSKPGASLVRVVVAVFTSECLLFFRLGFESCPLVWCPCSGDLDALERCMHTASVATIGSQK